MGIGNDSILWDGMVMGTSSNVFGIVVSVLYLFETRRCSWPRSVISLNRVEEYKICYLSSQPDFFSGIIEACVSICTSAREARGDEPEEWSCDIFLQS